MASVTETARAAESEPVTFAPYLLMVEPYERMVEAGIIGEDEPIFLWRGRLVEDIEDPPPQEDGSQTVVAFEDLPETFPMHQITVERYERMVEAGIFGANKSIFLWWGNLVEKMTKLPPHGYALMSLDKILGRLLPAAWHVRQEMPVIIGNVSEPEPDLSVVRGELIDYLKGHPRSHDTAFLVGVSDSSLAIDSRDKFETYAADGIAAYWIVNIPGGRIEVYTAPTSPGETPVRFKTRHDYGPDDEVPVILDGREVGRVAVRDVLPPPVAPEAGMDVR